MFPIANIIANYGTLVKGLVLILKKMYYKVEFNRKQICPKNQGFWDILRYRLYRSILPDDLNTMAERN